jgi:hypothetical protein
MALLLMTTDAEHRKTVLRSRSVWDSLSKAISSTVHIPDDIDGDVFLHLDIDEALLLYKMIVGSECDFPCVPSGKRLPVFKPLHHRSDEFHSDLEFSIVRRLEPWPLVVFFHLAGPFAADLSSGTKDDDFSTAHLQR